MLFTIGYEGISQDIFLDVLLAQGIHTLVDVRQMPLSRKPGFSKSTLSAALEAVGIEYLHLRLLGAPKEIREGLRETGDWTAYTRDYLTHLVHQKDALEQVVSLAQTQSIALLCFEADYRECHRSLISAHLEQEKKVDRTVHLWVKTGNPVEGAWRALEVLDTQNHPQQAVLVYSGD